MLQLIVTMNINVAESFASFFWKMYSYSVKILE